MDGKIKGETNTNLNDSVEFDVIVVALAGELNEILTGSRRVVVIHLDGKRAHGSLQSDLRRPSGGIRQRISKRH